MTSDGAADDLLDIAVAVHLGGVNDGDTHFNACPQCRHFSSAVGWGKAHLPGTKAKAGFEKLLVSVCQIKAFLF